MGNEATKDGETGRIGKRAGGQRARSKDKRYRRAAGRRRLAVVGTGIGCRRGARGEGWNERGSRHRGCWGVLIAWDGGREPGEGARLGGAGGERLGGQVGGVLGLAGEGAEEERPGGGDGRGSADPLPTRPSAWPVRKRPACSSSLPPTASALTNGRPHQKGSERWR